MVGRDGVGWCVFDGMGGAQPLSWSEIASFSKLSGLSLEPWEARQLRSMSAAYVAGLASGSNPLRPSPVFADRPEEDPGLAVERKIISDRLKSGFSALGGASD